MTFQAVRLICQLLLGALFVVSAAGKFRFPMAFLRSVVDYQLTPLWLSKLTAVTLPGVELVVGVVLLAGFVAEVFRGHSSRGRFGVFCGLDASRPGWLRRLDGWVEAAAGVAAGLLVFFMVLLSIVLSRGMKLDCGCFDFIGEYIPFLKASVVTWATVWRDAVMLLMTLPILARKP